MDTEGRLYCLGMNGISISSGRRRGGAQGKDWHLGRGKVFGQKVGVEISCSGISSGREGGKIFKKPVLQGLDCWAKMFGYYPEMQRSVGRFQSCKVRGEGDCGQGKRLLKSLGREHSQPKKTRVRVRYSLSQQN